MNDSYKNYLENGHGVILLKFKFEGNKKMIENKK